MTLPVPDAATVEAATRTALELAIRAAGIVADRPSSWNVETKTSATDPVTQQDIATEQAIVEWLRRSRPGDGIYGEELGSRPCTTGITWVIDPIDGTVNYLYGIPHVAVSIAAVVGDPSQHDSWRPVAGAVADVWHREVAWGAMGGGAYAAPFSEALAGVKGEPLQVSSPPDLQHSLLATGFSYSPAVRATQAQVLGDILPQVRDVRRLGSAALDLVALARGRCDGYYESCLRPWDVAAGWIIVEEAGGRVRGLAHADPTEALVLAAGPHIVDAMQDLVESSYARWGVVDAVKKSLPQVYTPK